MSETRSSSLDSATLQVPVTWVDVLRRLAFLIPGDALWPMPSLGLITARAYWTGLVLELRSDTDEVDSQQIEAAVDWLRAVFPGRVDDTGTPLVNLILEAPEGMNLLPVRLEATSRDQTSRQTASATLDPVISFVASKKEMENAFTPPLIACHAIKGGVGRTTTAVCIAEHLAARRNKTVLLVDADFEAPGISFLYANSRAEVRTSLEDLIALAHADPSANAEAAVGEVARLLRGQRIGKLYVLPVRRFRTDLVGSAVHPEHLTPRGSGESPLAFLLKSVAQRLGSDAVVVDLRAGLVPIAAELLLDKSTHRVLVTTLSGQSIEASLAMLAFLQREFKKQGCDLPPPLLVLNRIPSVYEASGYAQQIRDNIQDHITDAQLGNEQLETAADAPIESTASEISPIVIASLPELADLAVSDRTFDGFLRQIAQTEAARLLREQFDFWFAGQLASEFQESPPLQGQQATQQSPASVDIGVSRRRLATFAARFEAAETAGEVVDTPLATGPLRRLAAEFATQVPIVVVEGARGTGKTLTARFLNRRRTWQDAVNFLSGDVGAVDALLLPVISSLQGGSLAEEVTEQRGVVAAAFGTGQAIDITELQRRVHERVQEETSTYGASDIWLDAIAWSVGVFPGEKDAGTILLDQLSEKGNRLIAVIEGLEELFPSPSQPHVAITLRGLMVDLANRLRVIPRRPLGLIIFARTDSVAAAIPQNIEQFRGTYRDYALRWTEDDVLELAAWLATKSDALPDLWSSPGFSELSPENKSRALNQLWGQKLGPDEVPGGPRTQEAYTSGWVIAVLSDLQNRLTARDLVRLLRHAAERQPNPNEQVVYAKRLLFPRALRDAVDPTSHAKVTEVQSEIMELRPIFNKISGQDDVFAPLDQETAERIGLDEGDLEKLRQQGVLFGDRPPYEVPELFRMGLGLRRRGARTSVIKLLRRAQQQRAST